MIKFELVMTASLGNRPHDIQYKIKVNMEKSKTGISMDVDQYLAPLRDDVRDMLEKIRVAIKSAAPKAEEEISYQIPVYKYKGPLVFFAAFKDHCSLYVIRPEILELFNMQLSVNSFTALPH